MANLKRTRNKLLRSGYLPNCQVSETLIRTRTVETWVDTLSEGTPISFYIKDGGIDGEFKVHGKVADRPEIEEYSSEWTKSISVAISLSRSAVITDISMATK